MCGIAGYYSFEGDIDSRIKEHFSSALKHRGPDGEGIFETLTQRGGRFLLQHLRLSINDLKGGAQPLIGINASGQKISLSVNGEIYNAPELKEHYKKYAFKTQSDCEPLLPLYLEYGSEFARAIRGMYALALYDESQDLLILARDPFGIKPLYWRKNSQGFSFASTVDALLFPWEPVPDLNPQIQEEVLNLQFSCGSSTLFSGIFRLLPGEVLKISEGHIKDHFYVKALDFRQSQKKLQKYDALKKFEEVLTQTVSSHLMSDVPVGLFYSGGVDSSVILCALNLLGHKETPAFYLNFEGEKSLLSKKFPLKAQYETIHFAEKDFWDLLPLSAHVMDDCAADYAIMPTLKLAQRAAEHELRVILSGEGGDEIFAGYGRYKKVLRPWFLGRRHLRHKSLLQGLGLLREDKGWRSGIENAESIFSSLPLSPLQKAQALDLRDWLPHDLMTKLDRSLMHFGIEGRPPFLDQKLATFGFFLEDSLKIHKGQGKWLLKEWLYEKAPSLNPFTKKKGFTPPVGIWIAKKADLLGDLLKKQESLKIFCAPQKINDLFKTLGQKPDLKKEGMAAWIILFYALWYKIHVERVSYGKDIFDILEAP